MDYRITWCVHPTPSKWCLPVTYFPFSEQSYHSPGVGVVSGGGGSSIITIKVRLLPVVSCKGGKEEGKEGKKIGVSSSLSGGGSVCVHVSVCVGGKKKENQGRFRETESGGEGGW